MPTLIVAFNSDLHRLKADWAPTIQSLMAMNLPCVFTSCNQDEARLDAQDVERLGAKMIWQEKWNSWTGQRVVSSDDLNDDRCRFESAFTLGFQGIV